MSISPTFSEHLNEMYQTSSQKKYNQFTNEDGSWWSVVDSSTDKAGPAQLNFEDQDWAGILTPSIHQLGSFVAQEFNDTESGALYDTVDLTFSTDCERASAMVEPYSPDPAPRPQPHSSAVSQLQISWSSKKRRRKQNHSCDPCRVAKRACDLPSSTNIHNNKPVKGCSTCNTRGLECTASWLANMKSSRHESNCARTVSRIPGFDRSKTHEGGINSTLIERQATISAQESDLTRQITAEQTCTQRFSLYVDVWEMPMRDCLAHANLRSSKNSDSDFVVLTRLNDSASFSRYYGEAQSWIKNCWQVTSGAWETASPAPHLFFVVAVLDAVFQHKGGPTIRTSTAAREASINETYRWVALATASQFAVRNDGCDKSFLRARDFASTAWRRARQLVFENIAATSSFRLALALLLFGCLLPPTLTDSDTVEDVAYAQSEGIRRLQSLCAQARLLVLEPHSLKTAGLQVGMSVAKLKEHAVSALPPQVKEWVLELIAIVASLSDIVNMVAIVQSRGQVGLGTPDLSDSNVADMADEASATPGAQGPIMNSTQGMTRHEREVHDLTRQIRTKVETDVTTLWRQNVKEEVVLRAVQDSASIVVMLWKSLARLTVAAQSFEEDAECEGIGRQYASICTLVEVWRLAFGRFDESMSLSFQHCGPSLRRSVLFCSNDGDLAVLHLYEVVRQLETDLKEQPSTPARQQLLMALEASAAHREETRRISAMQISFLAANSQGLSSPGFQGASGLKAYIQDFAAHPHPNMMIQALSLAAKTFNDEVHRCLTRMDTEGACAMMVHLDACLKGLQGLKQDLAMFPETGHTV